MQNQRQTFDNKKSGNTFCFWKNNLWFMQTVLNVIIIHIIIQ